MPNLHDVERRINSVTSTKQITRTMQMVAAAKIRKAIERVEAATPYSNSMSEMLVNVSSRVDGSTNSLLNVHGEQKNVLIVAIVSDRGLAGGFNSNVLRKVESIVNEKRNIGANACVIACGKKAGAFLNHRKIDVVMDFKDLSADPTIEEASEISSYCIGGYERYEIDEVVVVYNHSKNAVEQVVTVETVLPVQTPKQLGDDNNSDNEGQLKGDIEFEPDAESVLEKLLPSYIRTIIYHALIDSAAGEQAARRLAMQSATDNANEMVETLTRLYNRVRQGAITTEITEIVGGVAALEE